MARVIQSLSCVASAVRPARALTTARMAQDPSSVCWSTGPPELPAITVQPSVSTRGFWLRSGQA